MRSQRLLTFLTAGCVILSAVASQAAQGLTGEVTTYTVASGDTWNTIGSRFGVYGSTIAADNHLDMRQPLSIGQQLRIDNRHVVPRSVKPRAITINVPQRMLFYQDDAGLAAYPSARWAMNCNHFQLAMLAYNLNCWLMLFNREEKAGAEELQHTTLAISRLRFLFLAAKIWRHGGRVGVSYSDP